MIDFQQWEGPWRLLDLEIYTTDGINRDEDTEERVRQWVRLYREKSHCDTPGCCEFVLPHLGPVVES